MAKQGKGLQTNPPKVNKGGKQNQVGQNKQWVKQTQKSDIQLGKTAKNQLGAINQAYSQPIDYSALPQAPVQADYNKWVDDQMAIYNQAYDARNNPQIAIQNEDLDQQLANKGIPMGSPLYEREKNRLAQQQADAQQQAYANNQSMANQSAMNNFSTGTQARGNAYAEIMAQRNQPLVDYGNLMAAQSGLGLNQLQNQQAKDMVTHQTNEGIRASNATYRAPSGGGSQPAYAQYGFTNPVEYDAYQDQRAMNQLQAKAELERGNQQKTPSTWSQLGGGLLGSVGQAWANNYFKS